MDPENDSGGADRQNRQNLSGRDFARSADHRRKFAYRQERRSWTMIS